MSSEADTETPGKLAEETVKIIERYQELVHKVLGSTPEEVKETHKALEGFTPMEIREALKLYRRGRPK